MAGWDGRPLAAGVVAFLAETPSLDLAISTLTVGEIRRGILQLDPGARRRRLETWLAVDLLRQFTGRALPVDEAVALAWGRLAAESRAAAGGAVGGGCSIRRPAGGVSGRCAGEGDGLVA